MATVESISRALNEVESKKENLRKAFEDLHSQSHHLSSFTLTWPELESHFTSLQSSLQHKFTLLQTQQPPQQIPPPSIISDLKSSCQKMDALAVRTYIVSHPEETIEFTEALKCAPDVATIVLDAMEGLYPQFCIVRTNCMGLLEVLLKMKPGIEPGVKEKAMEMAKAWKVKIDARHRVPMEMLGFLYFVAIYGLVEGFGKDFIVDFAVVTCKIAGATDVCRALNIGDWIPDIIEKLISKGNLFVTLKFVFEFEMTERFPPVSLLNAQLEESKEAAEQMRKFGKPLNEAITKEMNALQLVMGCIKEYKLESVYPKNSLMERIKELKEEKGTKKRAAASPAPKPQKQAQLVKKNKKKCAGQQLVQVAGSSGNAIPVAPSAGPSLPFPMLSGSYVLPHHSHV